MAGGRTYRSNVGSSGDAACRAREQRRTEEVDKAAEDSKVVAQIGQASESEIRLNGVSTRGICASSRVESVPLHLLADAAARELASGNVCRRCSNYSRVFELRAVQQVRSGSHLLSVIRSLLMSRPAAAPGSVGRRMGLSARRTKTKGMSAERDIQLYTMIYRLECQLRGRVKQGGDLRLTGIGLASATSTKNCLSAFGFSAPAKYPV